MALFVSNVLFRGFALGMVLMLLTAIPTWLMPDDVYRFWADFMNITEAKLDEVIIVFLGNIKLVAIMFFLVPAIAIRWALWKMPDSAQ